MLNELSLAGDTVKPPRFMSIDFELLAQQEADTNYPSQEDVDRKIVRVLNARLPALPPLPCLPPLPALPDILDLDRGEPGE